MDLSFLKLNEKLDLLKIIRTYLLANGNQDYGYLDHVKNVRSAGPKFHLVN